MSSRLITDLVPELQVKYEEFRKQMLAKGITFAVTCTARSLTEQMALYTQGRLGLGEVNKFRSAAGLYLIGSADNVKVTWTLASKHIVTKDGEKARAFDIVILKSGKENWDLKVDVNGNAKGDYAEAALIGREVGLNPGAFWSTPDYPHYEI